MNRRDAKMRLREREHRHSHRGGGDRTLESSPEDVPAEEEAEPTKRKAEETTTREQDIENQPSKKQRLETVTCKGDVGDSLMQAMERVLNQCSPKSARWTPSQGDGRLHAPGCYQRHQRTHNDFLEATPPLEAIRIICSLSANNQYGQQPYRIMTVDV